ncbi:unnamed protein product [Sphacelaria rigidula]
MSAEGGKGRLEKSCVEPCLENGHPEYGSRDTMVDWSIAAEALESSCLRSVCRQYMFGVDWRFVSAHRVFYRSLLHLLRDTLAAGFAAINASAGGQQHPGGRSRLAQYLLPASPDCPGLVDLLSNLCVALDDLIACPPQEPAPLPAPPTPLPPPSTPLPPPASPGLTHPPPSPASPHPPLMQIAHASTTAGASFTAIGSPGLAQSATPTALTAPTPPKDAAASAAVPDSVHGAQVSLVLAVASAPPAAPAPTPTGGVASVASPSSTPTVSTVVGGDSEVPLKSSAVPPLAPAHGSVHGNLEESASTSAAVAAFVAGGDVDSKSVAAAVVAAVGTIGDAAQQLQQQQQQQQQQQKQAESLVSAVAPPPPLPVLPSLPTLTPPMSMLSKPAAAAPSPPNTGPGTGTGGGSSLAEQKRAAQYLKEKREHEEGLELAELARTVEAAPVTVPASVGGTTGNGEITSVVVVSPAKTDANAKNCGREAADGVAGRSGVEECKGDELSAAARGLVEEVETVPSGEELYLDAIEGEQFDTMRMEAATSAAGASNGTSVFSSRNIRPFVGLTFGKPEQQHHFWRLAGAEGSVPPGRQRRLVRELRSLARELPLYWGSTVAVRVDEDRPHLLKAMVAAPGGTPYDSGLFQFDIYCPPQYPDVPPRVNLMTTGRGTVRFNPNLYPCGNVCLSLLGTWSGSPEMMWSPDASLLQVLLSIQART